MAYTNSSLVSYTKISPNKTSNRNHAIDTISIHCTVGQVSVQTLGDIFSAASRAASSNYGIGYDGKIGMYVEEKDRSWCTSSASNDNRAVTIEVASDTKEPYAVNSKAYTALLDLVTDICKRNGIKKLVWSTSKGDRINHLNGCNMTVHRDYANKSCPGTYLYNRHGAIAAEVNKRLSAKPAAPAFATTTATDKAPDVTYRVRAGGKWLPEVKNLADFAGIIGQAITDVAVKVSSGAVKYRVHVKGKGWLPYVTGYNTADYNNGYAGNGQAIDAVEIRYTPAKGVKSRKAKYRISPVKGNYWPWQYDNEKTNGQDGYAGAFGKTMDRLQIVIM